MTPPRVFITGMGHSGTSWCAKLFAAAGFDLGSNLKHATPRQGSEWLPAWNLIVGSGVRMGASENPDRHYWWHIDESRYRPVRRDVAPRFADLNWPEVVKIPSTFPSLFWDLINPGHVVVMVRDPHEWARSTQANVSMANAIPMSDRPAQYRLAIEEIRASLTGRAHTFVHFETAVSDPLYTRKRIGFLFDLDDIAFHALHVAVTRSDWVGLHARRVGA